MKTCSKCARSLLLDQFPQNGDRRRSQCRECYKQHRTDLMSRLQYNTPEEKSCTRCKQTLPASEFSKDLRVPTGLRAQCRGCISMQHIGNRYNITDEQYKEMTKSGCMLRGCGSFEQLHVDHDHTCCPGIESCGKCVRGVLCGTHNRGLGCFRDDPAALIAAAEYLTRQ